MFLKIIKFKGQGTCPDLKKNKTNYDFYSNTLTE